MIENALGYFNVDPGYQYSRGGRYEVCLSPLWPLGPPILGGSRSFSRFPPLSHITRALCLSWSDAPLYSRASWHAPRLQMMSPRVLTSWPRHTRDVLKSARGHNECLCACVSPPDIIVTPLFAFLTQVTKYWSRKYLKASSPLSVNNNKTLFLTEGPTFTVFLHGYWKVFICMIGSSPAHYWEKSSWLVPGRVTIIQSLSQSRAPRVPGLVTKFP